jgi:general stress protein 26
MEELTRSERIAKVADLVKDIRVAMVSTMDASGRLHSRPMATQQAPFDGVVWFLTSATSRKLDEIEENARVNASYASTSSERYVSLSGEATVVNDRGRIAEFWSPFMKAWFDGPDDPDIRLIRVDVEDAEYWDTPGGKVASLISLVKGAVTGDASGMQSDNQKVRL